MTRVLAAILACACLSPVAVAESRRALVVGIDTYAPPKAARLPKSRIRWKNLSGAVLDAEAWAALLPSRFGFDEADVTLLTNEKATRKALLAALDSLAKRSGTGDTVAFVFAGHGSQVANSRSPEADGFDESIVPADSWKGAADLRDKELAAAFAKILATGARLVAVFDSCHSGSISRGIPLELASRRAEPDTRDVKDGTVVEPAWKRGAIVFSAAQQDELAWEGRDAEGRTRGLFSLAMQHALVEASPLESAESVFKRVRARLSALGAPQVPVLEGLPERIRAPLFGSGAALAATTVAVLAVKQGWVLLQDGAAAGLTAGTELVPGTKGKQPRIRIEVVDGVARSRAKVVDGQDSDIAPGDLFVVDRWAPPAAPLLTLAEPVENVAASLAPILPALRAVAALAPSGDYVLEERTTETGAREVRFVRATSVELGTTLPADTEWIPANPERAVELWQRLSRLAGWLRMPSPPAGVAFPYRLVIAPAPCDGPLPASPAPLADRGLPLGSCAAAWLVADAFGETVESRWVTVLVVSSDGSVNVLFPAPGGVENRFPPDPNAAMPTYALDRFEITPPAGHDTYVLLTTTEQLASVSALTSDAVRRSGSNDPLTDLLSGLGRRRGGPPLRVGWSLQRVPVPSFQE